MLSDSRRRWMARLGATLLAGAAGAALARAVSFPGGAFTGALIVTAIVRLAGAPLVEPPKLLRSAARVVLGITIGATVTAGTIATVGRAFLPVLGMVLAMIALSLGSAYAISRLTRMPLPTALCGSSPGALAAMVALSEDLDGDPPVVASMHLVRLISVLLFMPAFVSAVFRGVPQVALPIASDAVPELVALRLAGLLVLGFVVGYLFVRLKVPAAELLAGLAVAAVLNPLLLGLPDVPGTWRLFAQWIVGAGVGATVTRAALRSFRPYALAGGLLTVLLILAGLGLGWGLAAVTELDLITAVVGSSPGGAETMMILAGELGADAQLVTAMHVSRLIIIMVLLPFLTRALVGRHAPAPEPARETVLG